MNHFPVLAFNAGVPTRYWEGAKLAILKLGKIFTNTLNTYILTQSL